MLTNSKIALSVALVLATASAAVGYPADGDPSCFDRESCRLHDAVGQCVREHIRHDGTAASQRAPMVFNQFAQQNADRRRLLRLRSQLRIYCVRMLRKTERP